MIIYKITNTINNKSYIGLTTKSFRQRYNYRDDWWNAPSVSRVLSYSVKKYGSEYFKVEIIDNGIDLWDLRNLEQYYIKKYNTLSPNGYNLTTGGEFCLMSEETKLLLSTNNKGKSGVKGNAKGHKKTKEHIEKLTAIRQKLFNSGKLKPWNKGIKTGRPAESAILNSAIAHQKKVKCMDLNGNLIKIYNSLTETKKDGFNPTNVCLCCKHPNKYKTHRNLKWQHV